MLVAQQKRTLNYNWMYNQFWRKFGCIPGKADSSAQAVGIPQYPCGDDMTEGLQHVLQLLLIHGQRQVGDVEVGGVLLLLL